MMEKPCAGQKNCTRFFFFVYKNCLKYAMIGANGEKPPKHTTCTGGKDNGI